MMIMITPQDFQRLSAACQRELLALLAPGDTEHPPREDEMSMPSMDPDQYGPMDAHLFSPLPPDDSGFALPTFAAEVVDTGAKQVIDISIEQARELIANVSERSQDALKLFAAGPAVPLATLVGPTAPYRDFNDLKRSLVGAVNRRLRTVTENRAAVLFSSDRDKTRIRITPSSATALRQALNVPEPLPSFEFFDRSGRMVSDSTELAIAFQNRVSDVWNDVKLRPQQGQISLTAAQVLRYLANNGFTVIAGEAMVDVSGGQSVRYKFNSERVDVTELISAEYGNRSMVGDTVQSRAFLEHSSCPEVVATIEVVWRN